MFTPDPKYAKEVTPEELEQSKFPTFPKAQKPVKKEREFLEGHPVLKGISDTLGITGLGKGAAQAIFLNFTQEGKDVQKLYQEGKITPEQYKYVLGGDIATPKEVIGGAVGLGTSILGATVKAPTAAARIAAGTGIGAGFGLSSGLQENKDAAGVAKSTVTGAAVGAAVSGAFEAAGKLLRTISQSKVVQRRTGNTYNKELQPKLKEVSADIEKGFSTFGEDVAKIVNDKGKPVYVGTYRTLLGNAKNELGTKGKELNFALKAFDKATPTTVTRQELAKGIFKEMQDTYGVLTPHQVKQIEFEIKRLPLTMNMEKVQETKRLLDSLIPDTFWSKLDDPAVSFPSYAKYILRDNARKIINEKTANPLIQKLNNEMSVAMDVKKLASNQIARRSLEKVSDTGGPNPISYALRKIWDDIFFNPAITTRSTQAIRRMGTKTGQTVPRTVGRQVLIRGGESLMNQ